VATDPNVGERLEAEIQRLEEALELQRVATQKRSRTLMIVSAAVALVVTGILFSSYRTVRNAWTEENFTRSLAREAERLTPMAVAELMILGENLLPVYAAASKEQLARSGSVIERALADELDAFLVAINHDAHERLVETGEQIRAGATQELETMFPSMGDPAKREEFVLAFTAAADHAFQEGMQDFLDRYTSDIERFSDSLAHFDMVGSDSSTLDLKKRLVHLWLQAIDERVMSL